MSKGKNSCQIATRFNHNIFGNVITFLKTNLNIREIWNWLCPMSKAVLGGWRCVSHDNQQENWKQNIDPSIVAKPDGGGEGVKIHI